MDHVDGYAPDLNLTAAVKLQWGIVRMGGLQAQPAAMAHQALEREGSVQYRYDHFSRSRFEAAIDHQEVTIVDAGVGHGVAADM